MKNWISGSGLTSSYFNDCIYLASFLGMIDESGESQDFWGRLRDSEQGRDHLAVALREGYEPILKHFGLTDVTADDGSKIQSWLRTNANASADDAVAAATTMIRLFDFAGGRESAVMTPKASTTGASKPKSKAASPPAATRRAPKVQVKKQEEPERHEPDPKKGKDVALTINLSLEIPATENDKVYEALFSSMAKHLGTLVSQ